MISVYPTLGVSPNANFGQLRLAYKEAARRVHPDVAGGSARQFHALQVCGEANRLTNQPEDYAAVLCGGCRSPLCVEKTQTRTAWRVSERNRRLLFEQTCDLIDTIEDEAILAMGNALAGQVRRLRRRLTGV